jgi:hypothetical protein
MFAKQDAAKNQSGNKPRLYFYGNDKERPTLRDSTKLDFLDRIEPMQPQGDHDYNRPIARGPGGE